MDRGLLDYMYRQFYGLVEPPFTIAPDPRFLYRSETHQEALAHLTFGIIQRKGFVVITGEVGTGKTTLIHALLADLPQRTRVAFISNPKLTAEEFFFLVAKAFELGTCQHKAEFILRFTEFLGKSYRAGDNVVLIVDEAHCLSPELMEEIRLLSNLEIPHYRLVNIFLVGQPELREKLATPEMLPLRQRISLYYHLSALTFEETAQYIETRLLHVGAMDLGLFTPQAVEAIYHFTQGLPRLINILADHALLTGYVKEIHRIDDSVIKECAKELASPLSRGPRAPTYQGFKALSLDRGARIRLCIGTAALLLGILGLWATTLDEGVPPTDSGHVSSMSHPDATTEDAAVGHGNVLAEKRSANKGKTGPSGPTPSVGEKAGRESETKMLPLSPPLSGEEQ